LSNEENKLPAVLHLDVVCGEMLEVLIKHKVSIGRLDGVLQHLKDLAYDSTPIQNVETGELSLKGFNDFSINTENVFNKVKESTEKLISELPEKAEQFRNYQQAKYGNQK
jgi:hypothetical protein